VLAGTLAILFGIGECTVRSLEAAGLLRDDRVFDATRFQSEIVQIDDPVLVWALDPAGRLVNAAGMRGPEVARAKPPGVFRIAVLGDSVTFGRGVPDDAVFPRRLEESLNEARVLGRPVEVLNFGVGGYNTEQEVEAYRQKARPFDPDAVILTYVLNDAITTRAALGALAAREATKADADATAAEPSAEPALFSFSSRLLAWGSRRLAGAGEPAAKRRAPFVEESHADPEGWAMVTESFAELAALAREDGVPVLLVIVPMWIDFDDYPFAALHGRIAASARRAGLDVLDLHPVLEDADAVRYRLDPHDLTHPDAEGHAAIARAIHAHLARHGWTRVGEGGAAPSAPGA